MTTQWKHIGFHGLAVGTFSCGEEAVVWRSAETGADETSTVRKLSKATMDSPASWTVFGKTGSLRLAGKDPKQHEWRLDGFPLADFDMLKSTLKTNYDVNLQVHNMSSAGTQYGLTKVSGKLLMLQHCELADVYEEGT
jgi:POB3-like N-terminal PH domain